MVYLAGRAWGLAPSEIWSMTISELTAEMESRGSGETYAGGMTEEDIENIKEESAALRAYVEAKKNGTATS